MEGVWRDERIGKEKIPGGKGGRINPDLDAEGIADAVNDVLGSAFRYPVALDNPTGGIDWEVVGVVALLVVATAVIVIAPQTAPVVVRVVVRALAGA